MYIQYKLPRWGRIIDFPPYWQIIDLSQQTSCIHLLLQPCVIIMICVLVTFYALLCYCWLVTLVYVATNPDLIQTDLIWTTRTIGTQANQYCNSSLVFRTGQHLEKRPRVVWPMDHGTFYHSSIGGLLVGLLKITTRTKPRGFGDGTYMTMGSSQYSIYRYTVDIDSMYIPTSRFFPFPHPIN